MHTVASLLCEEILRVKLWWHLCFVASKNRNGIPVVYGEVTQRLVEFCTFVPAGIFDEAHGKR